MRPEAAKSWVGCSIGRDGGGAEMGLFVDDDQRFQVDKGKLKLDYKLFRFHVQLRIMCRFRLRL
jgi:hypothetical protein